MGQVFSAWSQTTVLQDEKRALKRYERDPIHYDLTVTQPEGIPMNLVGIDILQIQDADAACAKLRTELGKQEKTLYGPEMIVTPIDGQEEANNFLLY